jgi:alpha-ketoglutaric semialdehyde dehydrogenase
MTQKYQNYIGGRWCDSVGGRTFDDVNPADTEEVVARCQQSTVEDIERAVSAAAEAFPAWRATPPTKRAEFLNRALAKMLERCDQFARDLTLENGKTLAESKAEIVSAAKEMAYQIAEGSRLGGRVVTSEQDGVFCFSTRQPLGVVGLITPWNFPFNVVCRKAIPALMAGNTAVFKPASFTPLTGVHYTQLFDEAGLPPGVLNLVTGQGAAIGDALVEHPLIRAISFTGSTAVGRAIERKAIAHGAKAQMEMGGKNPAVVLEDADLDRATAAILLAAYACAGQWCTSTSRVIVLESVARELVDRLVDGARRIVVGSGLDPKTTMGPVAGPSQLRTVLEYIEVGKGEGARLFVGGHRYTADGCERGTFVAPTIFADVQPSMRIAQEEIFGPVLSILVARDFDHAVEIANGVPYGLSSSLFTRDLRRAMSFIERTHVGLTHVNMPTGYKEAALEFGGVKESGAGLPESGIAAIEFFTDHKVAYVKYR